MKVSSFKMSVQPSGGGGGGGGRGGGGGEGRGCLMLEESQLKGGC